MTSSEILDLFTRVWADHVYSLGVSVHHLLMHLACSRVNTSRISKEGHSLFLPPHRWNMPELCWGYGMRSLKITVAMGG